MARVLNILRTCGIFFYFVFQVQVVANLTVEPWIVSLEMKEKSCFDVRCKYLLLVRGSDFLGHYSLSVTPNKGSRGDNCDVICPNYELNEIETSQRFTKFELIVPTANEKIYFCLRHTKQKNSPVSGKWIHQGEDVYLEPYGKAVSTTVTTIKAFDAGEGDLKNHSSLLESSTEWVDLSHDIDVNYLPHPKRQRRDDVKDIEIKIDNKYIPINEVNLKNLRIEINDSDENYRRFADNYIRKDKKIDVEHMNVDPRIDLNVIDRRKREIIKDTSYDSKLSKDGMGQEPRLEDLIQNDSPYDDEIINPQISDTSVIRTDAVQINLDGLRVEDSEKEPRIEDGIPSVLANTKVTIRLFGQGLTSRTVIAFTNDPLEYGQPCKFLLKGEYLAIQDSVTRSSALFEIMAPAPIVGSKLYVCAKNLKFGVVDPNKDEEKYIHQGTESYKTLATHTKLLPLWATIVLILTCLTFSALFSGLNLGLMSLDRTELKIISNTGTDQEKKYARAIMPVRDHGNYLLCSILLGNVAVNSTFTILLDDLTSGLFAVIFSTLSIVLLGEITPQAICSRYGLMIGARSIMVTKGVMALTAPLAFPVSKLLDYFLGEEIGNVYNRERLKELVKVTTGVNDLDKDEVNIISGALELRKKTVSSVMTKLEDVFMLPITSILDFETMSEIIKSGYSRIPVYESTRTNIVTVLFIKDLAFVDPDDNTPLQTLCQYYQNPCNFVFEDVTLDVMFKQFKDGHKGHMAFVHRINNEGEGDPFYETVGLVTLEDVIEEMIQAEIVDETDVFVDNRSKRRRNRPQHKLQDFAAFAERHENQRIHISPQLTLATFQYLSTSVDAFKPDTVSETVLRRLLKQDVIQYIKIKGKTKKEPSTYVYQQGKPVDYFVLVLEGRVEVTVGRENLVFEAGPFTYFGVQALTQNVGMAESPTPSAMGSLQNLNMDSMLRHTFVPDYSVRAITELYYLTVKRSLYLAAKRATLMEKGALSKGGINEQFDTEVDKSQLSLLLPSYRDVRDQPSTSYNYPEDTKITKMEEKTLKIDSENDFDTNTRQAKSSSDIKADDLPDGTKKLHSPGSVLRLRSAINEIADTYVKKTNYYKDLSSNINISDLSERSSREERPSDVRGVEGPSTSSPKEKSGKWASFHKRGTVVTYQDDTTPHRLSDEIECACPTYENEPSRVDDRIQDDSRLGAKQQILTHLAHIKRLLEKKDDT